MKILCLVSEQPGHLDFGGEGYVQLAKKLENQGHVVRWLAPAENMRRLRNYGFKSAESKDVGNLTLVPLQSLQHVQAFKEKFANKLKSIQNLLRPCDKYDLIMSDRLLAFAPFLAEKISKPLVVVGSPYSHFELTELGPVEKLLPVHDYLEVGELFRTQLKCTNVSLNSFWANSNLLNVCFVNKSFYQFANNEKSAFVNHFLNSREPVKKEGRVGFSLGNTGASGYFLKIVQEFTKNCGPEIAIDVYAGRNKETLEFFRNSLPSHVAVYDWVKFGDYFPKLAVLVCFGGISTIWEAINCGTAVIAAPDIGDQFLNADSLVRMGIGAKTKLRTASPDRAYETISKAIENQFYFSKNIKQFKDPSMFSGSLESVAIKISSY